MHRGLRRTVRAWLGDGGSLTGDLIVASIALALTVATMILATANGWRPHEPLSYVGAVVLAAAAWPACRLAPATTLVIVGAVVAWPGWLFDIPEARIAPLLVASAGAALRGASSLLVIPVVAASAVLGLMNTTAFLTMASGTWILTDVTVTDPSRRVVVAVALSAVIALAYAVRSQRIVAEHLRERNAELVSLQRSERERVAREVRTGIARDLHDVVAHHVSAMVIRAQTAERVDRDDPDALRNAVSELAREGSEALTAMRRTVRMMRDDGDTSRHDAAELDAEFGAIVARVRANGKIVDVNGSAVAGTEFVQVALLRVAQEALTNVLLHSDARRVIVTFSASDVQVGVTIIDDGTPVRRVDAPRGGNGLRGMRERAEVAGGSFVAGPRADGGWEVAVTVPIGRER